MKAENPISEEQKALLESLPPDQRSSIMQKMQSSNKLQEEISEVFEEESTLTLRPELKDITKESKFKVEEM